MLKKKALINKKRKEKRDYNRDLIFSYQNFISLIFEDMIIWIDIPSTILHQLSISLSCVVFWMERIFKAVFPCLLVFIKFSPTALSENWITLGYLEYCCICMYFLEMGTPWKKKHNGTKIMSLLFILNRSSFFFCRVEMVDFNYP